MGMLSKRLFIILSIYPSININLYSISKLQYQYKNVFLQTLHILILFIYVSIYLFLYLSIFLYIYMYIIYLSISPSNYLSMYISIYLSIYLLSIYPFLLLSIFLYIYYLSIYVRVMLCKWGATKSILSSLKRLNKIKTTISMYRTMCASKWVRICCL